jgi:hypothetical protein
VVKPAKPEKPVKEEPKVKGGFKINRWMQMPKGFDPPELDALAKRRKGLPATLDTLSSLYATVVPVTALRPGKVRKVDNDGTVRVYEVMAPVGQTVEGEILDEAEAANATVEPPAPVGTIIDGVGIVNADGLLIAQPTPRRKMPPPRRKPKKGGPGRSKKKILPELGPDGVPVHPPYPGEEGAKALSAPADGTEGGDTPMPDANDGEEDDDGESGEDGEDGEIMEDDEDKEDGEISGATTPARSSSALSQVMSVDEVTSEEPRALIPPPPSGLRNVINAEDAVTSPIKEEHDSKALETTSIEQMVETVPEEAMGDAPVEPEPAQIPEIMAEEAAIVAETETVAEAEAAEVKPELTEPQPMPDIAAEPSPPPPPPTEPQVTPMEPELAAPETLEVEVPAMEPPETEPQPELQLPVEPPAVELPAEPQPEDIVMAEAEPQALEAPEAPKVLVAAPPAPPAPPVEPETLPPILADSVESLKSPKEEAVPEPVKEGEPKDE